MKNDNDFTSAQTPSPSRLDEICNGDDWEQKNALIHHLEEVYNDTRDEIKQRINQRDGFAIQYLVAVGAVVTAILSTDLQWSIYFTLLIPLLAIFYSTQILYSYTMTDKLSKYIREELDPPIEKLLGTNEWESYAWRTKKMSKVKTTGIRKGFFRASMWVITILSLIVVVSYLSINSAWAPWNMVVVPVASIISLYLCTKIEFSLYRQKQKKSKRIKEEKNEKL